MSFTSVIKKELTQLAAENCCKRAELSALVRMNGMIQLQKNQLTLDITTENPSTARYIFSLIKQHGQVQPEIFVRKKIQLKKNHIYRIRLSEGVSNLLSNLYIFKKENWEKLTGISPALLEKNCCKRAYLRGAFLAGGSVNHPDSASYHLEIVSTYFDDSEALCKLMNQSYLHARIIERKKGFVVYVKEGDKIGEFLNMIGAHPSLLCFEDVRIMKDMRNSINRLVNCEAANLHKTVQAAIRQMEKIRLIGEQIGLDQLPDSLRKVAETRLKYPDANLVELGQLMPNGAISKSAINHRLRKLEKIANQLHHHMNEGDATCSSKK
jgi:cell division protein WhiA